MWSPSHRPAAGRAAVCALSADGAGELAGRNSPGVAETLNKLAGVPRGRLLMRLWRRSAGIVALALALEAAQPQAAWVYEIKAVFLYHFAKYVEWPPARLPVGSGTPLGVCVIGRDPFGTTLEETVRDRTVRGRPIRLSRISTPADMRQCHVLFVGLSDAPEIRAALDAAHGTGVLTVGESAQFQALGGMVRFVVEKGRVRFDVNQETALRSGLRISSRLLKLARSVKGAVRA